MLGGCKNIFLATSLLPLASSMLVLPPSSVCRRHFHHNTDVKSYYKANSKERYIHRNDRAPKAAHDDKYVLEWKEDMIDVITNNKSNSDDDDGHLFNAALFSVSKAWGRRPFLLRNAFDPDKLMTLDEDIDIQEADDNDHEFSPMTPWPSWQDVVDIASDDDAESRVISHIPGDYSTFDIRWGALSDEEIDKWLSKEIAAAEASNQQAENVRKETLVVNDVDRFHPPLADWIYDTFNFIPNWRMDDGQISLAEVDGGIGPHVDNYDVFLIQMNGSRTWQVGKRKIDAMEERDRLISGIDVRVLSDWDDGQDADNTEVEEWILKPGDMLYLPPRVPHCGVALSAGCMTLSVGCRAPSVSDLVSRLAEQLSNSIEDVAVRRYTDDDLLDDGSRDNFSPGEITAKAKEDAKRLILNALTNMMDDDSVWDEFFGRYCTEPKGLRNNYPIPLEDDDEFDDGPTVQDVLDGRGVLYHAEGLCFSHSELKSQDLSVTSSIHRLFINGEMWQGDTADDGILYQTIANNRVLDGITLSNSIGDEERRANTVEFLEELVSSGLLYVSIE